MGSSMLNRAPPPGASSHQTRPPRLLAVSATMLSPRPLPGSDPRDPARTNRSKMRSRSASGTPSPAVVDVDANPVADPLHGDRPDAAGVPVGVVEEVDQGPAELLLVDADDEVAPPAPDPYR